MKIIDHQINVEVFGPETGDAIVLLHHGLGSIESWKYQIPDLVAAGFQVIAYDRWGYGRSDSRDSLSMPFFSVDLEDLSSLLDGLDLNSVNLVGHSDGGTIALYYALQAVDQVESLVVVAAHIYIEPIMNKGIQNIRHAFESDQKFRQGLARLHGEQYEQVFNNWYHGWYKEQNDTWNILELLTGVKCPTLVVQGALDEHASPRHAVDIAERIPNSELWLVPNVSHMVPQEVPQLFNSRVIQFIRGKYVQ